MKKTTVTVILSLVFIMSCSKNKDSASNALVGTWVFTNQVTNSYAYPSVLINHTFPVASSTWSTSLDSIKINFDEGGNYTFWNFNLPVDHGKYRIAQDSFIIIKPDTSGFVKFNYSLPSITGSSGNPPLPSYTPYSNFHFSTDTILFKNSTGNTIIFSASSLTKANYPILPSNDTLVLHLSSNYFKRQ